MVYEIQLNTAQTVWVLNMGWFGSHQRVLFSHLEGNLKKGHSCDPLLDPGIISELWTWYFECKGQKNESTGIKRDHAFMSYTYYTSVLSSIDICMYIWGDLFAMVYSIFLFSFISQKLLFRAAPTIWTICLGLYLRTIVPLLCTYLII